MKEVFTKSFWQGVKRTFDEAKEDPPPADNGVQTPADGDSSASTTLATPSSPRFRASGTSRLQCDSASRFHCKLFVKLYTFPRVIRDNWRRFISRRLRALRTSRHRSERCSSRLRSES